MACSVVRSAGNNLHVCVFVYAMQSSPKKSRKNFKFVFLCTLDLLSFLCRAAYINAGNCRYSNVVACRKQPDKKQRSSDRLHFGLPAQHEGRDGGGNFNNVCNKLLNECVSEK